MRIAFLTSIYPAHAEKIYKENITLKNQTSEQQMEYIRWHALSSYVKWYQYIEKRDIKCLEFINNVPEIALKWAKENNYLPKFKGDIMEIGHEMIRRFKPDIIFVFAPKIFIKNKFLYNLVNSFNKRPKLLAWYGANSGDESIFNYFDLTLSNSKHLVNNIQKNGNKADFLQHAFDPIILEKIKTTKRRTKKSVFLAIYRKVLTILKKGMRFLVLFLKKKG